MIFIRILLTIALLVAVYFETGIWTALCFGLMFLSYEMENVLLKKEAKSNLESTV